MMLNWLQIADVMGATADKLRCHKIVESISSTNDWNLWSCGYDQVPAVCLAEQQISGRGRHGRQWVSPWAENIYLSLVWSFGKLTGAELNGLSLAVGLAVSRVLSQYGIRAMIKWPNDVLVDGHKIAGILIESRLRQSGEALAVIGVGLNYRFEKRSQEQIDQASTDLSSHCAKGALPSRNHVAGILINELIKVCEKFTENGFLPFIDEWNNYDACAGHVVTVRDASDAWTGKVIGVNAQGALRVLRDEIEVEVYAADVSIRIK